MTKILLEAYACSPNGGSEKSYGWNTLILLSKLGYDVHCLTSIREKNNINEFVKFNKLPKNVCIHFVACNRIIEFLWKRIPFGYTIHYTIWLWYSGKYANKIDANIDFDVLHHITYGSLQQGSWLFKLKKKFIFGPTGGGQFPNPNFKYFYSTKGWKLEKKRETISFLFEKLNPAFKQTSKNANHILCTNEETFALAQKHRGHKEGLSLFFDVNLPNSFFPSIYLARNEFPDIIKILWLGTVIPRKGISIALNAIANVSSDKEFIFNIVGPCDFDELEYLNEIISKLKIKNIVNFIGQVPNSKISKYYEEADIFLFSSLRESMGLQLLEAMAFGLPIVCLNIHGQKLLVPDDCGFKINVDTPEKTINGISNALKNLIESPTLRKEMGQKAYVHSKQFNWESTVQKFKQIYEQGNL